MLISKISYFFQLLQYLQLSRLQKDPKTTKRRRFAEFDRIVHDPNFWMLISKMSFFKFIFSLWLRREQKGPKNKSKNDQKWKFAEPDENEKFAMFAKVSKIYQIIQILRNRLGFTCTLMLGAWFENFVAFSNFSIFCPSKSVKEPKMHPKTDLDMKLRIRNFLEFFDANFVDTTIFKIILWFSINFVLWRPYLTNFDHRIMSYKEVKWSIWWYFLERWPGTPMFLILWDPWLHTLKILMLRKFKQLRGKNQQNNLVK